MSASANGYDFMTLPVIVICSVSSPFKGFIVACKTCFESATARNGEVCVILLCAKNKLILVFPDKTHRD